jgi:hypothetical protein
MARRADTRYQLVDGKYRQISQKIKRIEAMDLAPVVPCEPELFHGPGGWVARTPDWHTYRIGVVGDSEAEVREKFKVALACWRELATRGGSHK